MSERRKPHNGRDRSGHFKVKQADVDDLLSNPHGAYYVRDDVRLGGAVIDVDPATGRATRIERVMLAAPDAPAAVQSP